MALETFHPHQQSYKRVATKLCHPKFYLPVYLLLLAVINTAAVPHPRVKPRQQSLTLSHRDASTPQAFTPTRTNQNRQIIPSPHARARLHALQQTYERPGTWNAPQMKEEVKRYKKSRRSTGVSRRRKVLFAEHTSEEDEEAHSYEEEVGGHSHEETDGEAESEEEEETEEEGGEEEYSEEGGKEISRAETEHHLKMNEDTHEEGEPGKEEIMKTIRTAAEQKPEDTNSSQEIAEQHMVKEDIQATENAGESTAEENEADAEQKPKTDGVSKNRNVFRGVPGGAVDGTNITHVSLMVYKLVKAHEIKTVVDIPCRNNLSWFPTLLERLDFEIVGFKYMCVDKGARKDAQLHSHFTDAGSPEFHDIEPKHADKLPKSDLVLSFDGPQQWGVRKTWSFFLGLRKSRPKYIIVTNNPGQKSNDNEKILNLRKQPFHFTQPIRVISNVETEGNPKQLVFYEIQNVREGF